MKRLDKVSPKGPRGRRREAEPDQAVRMRTLNYRRTLRRVWPKLGPELLKAETADDVATAWFAVGLRDGEDGFRQLTVLAGEILAVIKEKGFLQLGSEAQPRYVADSLATVGRTSFRRSRDIAAKAEPTSSEHQIQYAEAVWYVECSCGHKGPSKAYACQECGAKIPIFYLT
jgi:hypothetical protein